MWGLWEQRYGNVRFNNGTRLGCDHVFAMSIVGLPEVSGAMVQRVAAGWRISSLFSPLFFLSAFWEGWGRIRQHVWWLQLLLALVGKAGPGDKPVHSGGTRKGESGERKWGEGWGRTCVTKEVYMYEGADGSNEQESHDQT